MLPININFGENHYLDKVTIQPEQFYTLLKENKDYPKSSQVNEKSFTNLYSHLASHYDSIIAIHLSDKLSGTFNSSKKAAQAISTEFNKPVSVINSKNLSGALGLVVLRTAKAIESGFSHDQIVTMAENWTNHLRIFVSVRSIKYLVRGGRLSLMIVSIDDSGKAIVFDKSFNQRANMEKVMRYITKISQEKTIWNYVVLHANNTDAAKWYAERMQDLTHIKPVSVVNISPIIGANAGIGAASVALLYD
jgi:DegV family protein with EDD domain